MTSSQKQKYEACLKQLENIKNEIEDIKAQCKHESTKEIKYMDYDTNCIEIKCIDCGKVLYDSTLFQYNQLKKKDIDYKIELLLNNGFVYAGDRYIYYDFEIPCNSYTNMSNEDFKNLIENIVAQIKADEDHKKLSK